MESSFLRALVLDYWYKLMIAIAFTCLILSLTVNLVGVDNNAVQLISLGCIFWGIGEWINHPLQQTLVKAAGGFPVGKTSGHPRNGSIPGYFFDLVGLAILGLGIYKLF